MLVDIMQLNPGPEKPMSCAVSIIGQCIYYAIGAMDNLDPLADSVWHFSLGEIAKNKEEFLSSSKAEA